MGFKLDDDRGLVSEINVTPFVDVMLVLLIIFMVSAPLLESGIPLQLPRATAKALPKTEEAPVTVQINKDARIFIGHDEFTLGDLPSRLKTMFRKKKRREIFIKADGSLPYEFVARTMAAIKAGGIDKIGLVTQPPEEVNRK